MDWTTTLALVVAVALAISLGVALIAPEKLKIFDPPARFRLTTKAAIAPGGPRMFALKLSLELMGWLAALQRP